MQLAIELDGPVDLATLDDFLASDRAPPDCMQLSELDGYLAGIVVGPQPIPPDTWLPMVWRCEDDGVFADLKEAQAILGIVMRRYNEITRLIDAGPGAYAPVLVAEDDGTFDPSDWAVGFIQATSLCEDGWESLVCDPMACVLMIPIIQFASRTDMADLPLDDDERLPEEEMAKLLANAAPTLSLCVSAIRDFFQTGSRPKRRRR